MNRTLQDATLPVQLKGSLFGDDIMKRTSVVGHCPSNSKRSGAGKLAGLLILALLLLCSLVCFASAPAVVGSSQTNISALNGVIKVATDSQGNIFVAAIPAWPDGVIIKLPANGGPPQQLASGINALWGLAVGPDGSVYYTTRWNGNIGRIQYLGGGVYAGAGTINLNLGWYPGTDVAVDSTGAIYLAKEWGGGVDKVTCASPSLGTTCSSVRVLQGPPSGGEIEQLALDAANNLYLTTDNGKVFRVAAGGTTAVEVGTGVNASGASVDTAGNLIITDKGNNRIVIIPNVGGNLDTASQFTAAAGLSLEGNAAADPSGNLFFATGSSLTKLSFANADFGKVALSSTSATATINYVFNKATTPTINLVIKGHPTNEFAATGGSCASGVARAAGDVCSIDVSFTPTAVGERVGAVVLADPAGVTLSAFPVSGIGDGPGILVDPGTQSSMADKSNFSTPQAVALDGAGNLYVADTGNSQVFMLPAGGGAPESIGSGLTKPAGVAVDAAGNVFISNTITVDKTEVGQVLVVPNEGGKLKNSDQFVIATGLGATSGLAVDRFGNVFVADTGNKRVLKLSKNLVGGYSVAAVVGSGYKNPVSVTADASGNVFVGDGTEGVIYGINASSGSQYFVVTGLGFAGGLATDASGSIYVADSVNKVVSRIPLQNGGFFPNGVTWIGSGFVSPKAVAIDAVGNAYIADAGAPGAFQVLRGQGLIDFGQFNIGIQSDTYISKLYNYGTQPLTVSPFADLTGDFNTTQKDELGVVCLNAAIDPGKSCTLKSYFTPQAPGTRTATLSIASDGGAIQQIYKGEGVALAGSTITIAKTAPSGDPLFGSTITFSATVAATSGSSVPTGSVVFAIDGIRQAPVALAAGKATFTTASMTGGKHNVTATYTGDASFASSVTAPPALEVNVQPAVATVVVYATSTTYGVRNTYNIKDTATVTAVVTAPIKTIPTGTVAFSAGNTPLGIATVSSGVASITIPVGKLVEGTYQLKAVYNEDNSDTNFAKATSPAVNLVVTPDPTFTLTSDVASATVKPGETGVFHITLSPQYNFQDTVTLNPQDTMNLNCQGLLPQTACLFTLTGNGTSSQSMGTATATFANGAFPSITLQLTTVGPGNGSPTPTVTAMTKSQSSVFLAMMVPGFLGIFSLAGLRKSRTCKIVGIALVLLAFAFLMAGCSASHSDLPAKVAPSTGTAAGTTTVTVVATSTSSGSVSPSVTQTMQFKFTVVN